MVGTNKAAKSAQVAQVFTPGAPIDKYDLLAGRVEVLLDVINAIAPKGQHAVVYGERGVGKTSLTNVLGEVLASLQTSTLRSAHINCNTTDSFRSIWLKVFRELSAELPSDVRPDPEDVRYHLEALNPSSMALVIIDELDRLEDDEALSLMADTIKTLSDHATPTTLVLVGVADSVTELVGDHLSVERALIQIPMPRMSRQELGQIIDKGLTKLEMAIDSSAKERIARLSEGLPYYTHLLALHATQRAVMDDRDHVHAGDVDTATRIALKKAQQTIQTAYLDATRSPRSDNKFKSVLLACALAPKDPLGYFQAGGVRKPLATITGREHEIASFTRHLGEFLKPHRGPALTQIGESHSHYYRFTNPMLQPYTIINGIADELITEDQVVSLESDSGISASSEPGRLFELPPSAPPE